MGVEPALQNGEPSVNKEACQTNKRWCLEGYYIAGGELVKIDITTLPLRIGRSQSAQFSINHPSVSRVHAEIVEVDGCLAIHDFESRNGTYVNYAKITGTVKLHPGDYVHLGSCEFRVVAENETLDEYRNADETWVIKEPGGVEFQNLINDEAVYARFQPVVLLEGDTIFGYESLGRGNFPGAPTRPDELFRIAKRYGYSRTLSSIFRDHALKSAQDVPGHYLLFMNVHPDELKEPEQFINKMAQVHDIYPQLSLVAEIPEGLPLDTSTMLDLRSALRGFGYGIAYDDFGVGQSRLVQLSDCPPDYLKFDRALIAGIDKAPAARQNMVRMFVDYAASIGVATVAEGVETLGESETCRQMGFRCGQGYLYGRPMSAEEAFGA